MIASTNTVDNWVALGLVTLGVLYLLVVLIFPERF
jgi:hypothetical protein